MKLSVKKIETLAIGKTVCDGRNLYFTKTSSNGGKWSFRYQRDGKSREMGLGPYPVITIDKARYKAQQNLILLYEAESLWLSSKRQKDKQQRLSHLFSSIAEQYIERNRSEWTSKKHEQGWLSMERLRLSYS